MLTIDTSLTFQDFILRTAEKVGLCDYPTGGVASIPLDLDRCKRAVNDGIEMIYRAYPKWTFLSQVIEITTSVDGSGPTNIENDPARYVLPWYVTGQPNKDPVWSNTPTAGWGGAARLIDYNQVLLMRARSTNGVNGTVYTGWPRFCATTTYEPSNGGRRGWELILYPNPNLAFLLRMDFRVFAPKMIDLTDRHVMGAQHDQTLIDAAAWAFKRDDSKDPADKAMYKQEFEESVKQSIAIDLENAPKTLGPVTDPSVLVPSLPGVNRMTYGPVTTYNGAVIP
jgi:hypothetical protein